ncbi:MAG: ABC transporter permease [Campylobacterales bacterium]|nr:ABC transporter permease [Campylobacterales bacterium]
MLKRYLANIKKEFILMSRDIHTLLVLFVMPVAFILIMSLAMQDAFSEHKNISFKTILYAQEKSELTDTITQALKKSNSFELSTTQDANIKKQMDANDILLGIYIEEQKDTPKITLYLSPKVSPDIALLFRENIYKIAMQYETNKQISSLNPWLSIEDKNEILKDKNIIREEYIGYSDKKTKRPSSVQQSVPAWLIFSMFFIVIPISNTFINERRQETLSRLAVMNISVGELLLSKLIPYYIINTIQMILMVLMGIYLVPLLGGEKLMVHLQDWPLLILVSSFISFASISFALAISSFVKTTEQAVSLGGLLNIIFAALGGVMVPIFIMPQFMQYITNLSPMAWSLEAFLAIFLYNGDLSKTIMPIISLTLFGSMSLMVASYKLKKEVTEG